MHWAAISGHDEIVNLLLSKGANILAETTSKATALHCAVEANRVETVRTLMQAVSGNEEKKTALTMVKNNEEKTAWDLAFNAKNTRPTVHLPPAPNGKKWYRLVDTALAAPNDYIDNPIQFQPQKVICKMEAYSSIILIAL